MFVVISSNTKANPVPSDPPATNILGTIVLVIGSLYGFIALIVFGVDGNGNVSTISLDQTADQGLFIISHSLINNDELSHIHILLDVTAIPTPSKPLI